MTVALAVGTSGHVVELLAVCVCPRRTGLVMQLQYAVGYDVIDGLETAMANEARRVWAAHRNIAIAGNTTGRRVGIISFQVDCFHFKDRQRPLSVSDHVLPSPLYGTDRARGPVVALAVCEPASE
jgi:hypothetical protein